MSITGSLNVVVTPQALISQMSEALKIQIRDKRRQMDQLQRRMEQLEREQRRFLSTVEMHHEWWPESERERQWLHQRQRGREHVCHRYMMKQLAQETRQLEEEMRQVEEQGRIERSKMRQVEVDKRRKLQQQQYLATSSSSNADATVPGDDDLTNVAGATSEWGSAGGDASRADLTNGGDDAIGSAGGDASSVEVTNAASVTP